MQSSFKKNFKQQFFNIFYLIKSLGKMCLYFNPQVQCNHAQCSIVKNISESNRLSQIKSGNYNQQQTKKLLRTSPDLYSRAENVDLNVSSQQKLQSNESQNRKIMTQSSQQQKEILNTISNKLQNIKGEINEIKTNQYNLFKSLEDLKEYFYGNQRNFVQSPS